MSDFFKRGGESVILFAEKELKPKGWGTGRGGGLFLFIFIYFFCKAGGGEYYCLGARWADGEGGGGEDYDD